MIELDRRLRELIARSRHAMQSHRTVFLAVGIALFMLGLGISIRAIDAGELAPVPSLLFLNAIILTPIALLLNAWGLCLSARVVGTLIGARNSLAVTCGSTIAEVLPIPAGLIARTAALVSGGASAFDAGSALAAAAFLWVGLCGVAGSLALLNAGANFGGAILIICGMLAIAGSAWILRRAGARTLVIVWFHRLLSLFIVVARVFVTYRGLGGTISPIESSLLASSYVIGSLSTVLPAGLGIGEGLSALAAHTIGVDPALAFMATAINRLLTTAVAGLIALPMIKPVFLSKVP